MHPLAILAVGLYGEVLPNQNGAPIRLVVPWKYGFKSIKSIVRIRFTDTQPRTAWNVANAHEYGFYSNVNPTVDHPRWSQATERRLGEFFRRKTLMFNGYGDQVAQLYAGMDLRRNYCRGSACSGGACSRRPSRPPPRSSTGRRPATSPPTRSTSSPIQPARRRCRCS
jgi:hypothetical protein